MKIQNKENKDIIDVSEEHFEQVLSQQGWVEHKEVVKSTDLLVDELKKELTKTKRVTKK